MDYNKLLEKARKVYAESVTGAEKRRLESIFPELEESEDERIRKEILEYIDKATGCKEWVAWLEKQCEQKPFDVEEVDFFDDFRKTDSEDEPKFHEGDWITNGDYTWKIVEEELRKIEQELYPETLDKAIELYYYSYGNDKGGFDNLSLEKFKDIVKTFVDDYGMQKPAWSKKDEIMIDDIILDIQYTSGSCKRNIISDKKIAWLKSIKPQPYWKPTDEQMEALEKLIVWADELYDENSIRTIESLYNDLKKL